MKSDVKAKIWSFMNVRLELLWSPEESILW
jgi:hypothetical protein